MRPPLLALLALACGYALVPTNAPARLGLEVLIVTLLLGSLACGAEEGINESPGLVWPVVRRSAGRSDDESTRGAAPIKPPLS